MAGENTRAVSMREELGAVPKYLWAIILIVMGVVAVLPSGLAGCIHGAQWLFGFPYPNCRHCGPFTQGLWLWQPVAIVLNQVFWLLFLGALAVISPKIGERYRVAPGLFFLCAVLELAILYFLFYRDYAILFAGNAF